MGPLARGAAGEPPSSGAGAGACDDSAGGRGESQWSTTKIAARHLERRAVVYVRQSTLGQLRNHPESTARQYALAERARELGWPEAPDRGRSTPTLATVRASMRRARARALTNCAACSPGIRSGACSGLRYRAWRGTPWNGFNSSICVARTMWRSSRTTTCTCRAATMTASSWASEVRCRPPSCRSCGRGWRVDGATRRCAARCTGAWPPALCAKGTPSARIRTSACRHPSLRCSLLSGRRATARQAAVVLRDRDICVPVRDHSSGALLWRAGLLWSDPADSQEPGHGRCLCLRAASRAQT